MRSTKLIAAASLIAMLCSMPTMAQNVLELTGTLRDFSDAHSDFENTYNGQYPLITGMVKTDLGADGRPVLNVADAASLTQGSDSYGDARVTCTFYGNRVGVTSTATLSYVKFTFSDGTTYTHSNLTVMSGEYAIPAAYQNKTLTQVKVRVYPNGVRVSKYFDPSDAGAVGVPAQWRIASVASFNQWYSNVAGVNESVKHTITLTDTNGNGVYRYEASKHNGQSFFPLDGLLLGNQGRNHNFHFTYNIHTKFTYSDPSNREPMTFSFSGDDDVWVYINKKLVVDLGGVHGEQYASVNVDSIAANIGLEPGKTYDFDFFFAERHTTESNCTIETSIQFLSPLYD